MVMQTRSIKFKFSVAFLILMLPILSSIVAMYQKGYASMIENGQERMILRQNNIKIALEKELHAIYDFQLDYTISSNVDYLTDVYYILSETERYEYISKIMEELELIYRNNDWIEDIRINIPELQLCISQNRLEHFVLEKDQLSLFEATKSHIVFPVIDGCFCISSKKMAGEGGIKYNIICSVSSEKLEEFINSYFTGEDQIYLIAKKQNCMLASSNEDGMDVSEIVHNMDAGTIGEFTLEQVKYYVYFQDVFFGNLQIVSTMPERWLEDVVMTYQNLFTIALILTIVAVVLYYFIFSRMIDTPIKMLLQNFRHVQKNKNMVVPAAGYRKRDEFQQLFEAFEQMMSTLQDYIYQNYYQEILVQQMHLRQLQAQIDPHFLHNCFLNIYSLASFEDCTAVQSFTMKLAKYYEYVTKNYDDIVSINQEYEFSVLYIEIQSMRFGERINAVVDPLPENVGEIRIPRFIIQPLLENAYKYGGFSNRNKGEIRLCVRREGKNIWIEVQDNGENFNTEKLSQINEILSSDCVPRNTTGLYNVQQRIRLFYKNESHLEVFTSEMGGLGVRLLIRCEEN